MTHGVARYRRYWRGAWALGFALLCVYIVFDVLDLDGSELQRHSGFGLVAAASAEEVERLFRLDLSSPDPWMPVRSRVACCAFAETARGRSETPPGAILIRYSHLLPRRQLSLTASNERPSSPDPL
jgi:hypothetical protein